MKIYIQDHLSHAGKWIYNGFAHAWAYLDHEVKFINDLSEVKTNEQYKLFICDSKITKDNILYLPDTNLNKNNNIYCDEIFFILFFPGMDMIRLTFQRIYDGHSPSTGDTKHIHHLMCNLIKKKYIFLVYVTITVTPILIYNFFIQNFYIVFTFSLIKYFLIFFLLTKLKKN